MSITSSFEKFLVKRSNRQKKKSQLTTKRLITLIVQTYQETKENAITHKKKLKKNAFVIIFPSIIFLQRSAELA